MSFIGNFFSAVVSVIVSIVETVIQVVELVIQAIMVLLGFDGGSSQTVEYYEVRNVPLFNDPDKKSPLVNSILQSILMNRDVIANLIYHTAFRSLKGNVREFLNFIAQGNYFESFPTLDSHIATIDYTELTAALNTLNSVPCTPEGSFLRALTKSDWVKYWLQENKEYNVGTNTLGTDYSTTSTTPASISADTVSVTPSTNHFDISITSGIATSDAVAADERWQVNLTSIVYNSTPDTYTISVYNATGVTRTLPYTAPTKPTQLHYVSTYYRDSAPSRKYLFIYKLGTGVYTDLDTIETPIDIDGTVLQVLPAVPLRISNSNYTTFGATKRAQIENILKIIHLDAEAIIDTVLTDSGLAAGDVDNVYVNFGIRMWDTSQVGMGYLFKMFENLYPAQGHNLASYNNAAATDDKPQNNILTTTADNKYAFQWSYITFAHTSLSVINASSGSTENGLYYSDMSRFSGGVLKYPYYVSSGKGTYNVGYKADTLAQVAAFLAGNGVTNPGTTTAEAANWLQVTERMAYNNTTPVLQESDGSVSDLIYLTPDLVYENNGAGVLKLVESASEATTVGQSITYYHCRPSGLDAYTVVAPIGALKVIDGASGRFNMVKFNLGNKGDLMVPFVHTFVKDFSNSEISKLFLAGAHVSIYIAHYEVIVQAGMSFLEALVIIIIVIVIIVIIIYFPPAEGWAAAMMDTLLGQMITAAGVGGFGAVMTTLFAALPGLLIDMVVQQMIQLIITEIAGDNETLAMILNIVAMVAMSGWEGGELGFELNADYSINWEAGLNTETLTTFNYKSLSDFTALDYAKVAMKALSVGNTILVHKTRDMRVDLEREMQERKQLSINKWDVLEKIKAELDPANPELLANTVYAFMNTSAVMGAGRYNDAMDRFYDMPYMSTDVTSIMAQQLSASSQLTFA